MGVREGRSQPVDDVWPKGVWLGFLLAMPGTVPGEVLTRGQRVELRKYGPSISRIARRTARCSNSVHPEPRLIKGFFRG
jgi:hypothetical protein